MVLSPGLLCHMLPFTLPQFPGLALLYSPSLSQLSGTCHSPVAISSQSLLGLDKGYLPGHLQKQVTVEGVIPLCEQTILQLSQTSHPKRRTGHGLQRWQTSRVKKHSRSPA